MDESVLERAEVLRPLAARYAWWLGLPSAATGDTSDEDPALVRAMPLVLRLDRQAPPPRSAVLEAAAAAAVALCLHPDAAPGGPWHADVTEWLTGRIRKVARRARGAHWAAVSELPGFTARSGAAVAGPAESGPAVGGPAESGPAEVRALLPYRQAQTPREVTRLQISGTDLPDDEPGPPPPGVPRLWLNPGVELSVGKAAAQVGHASMILAAMLYAGGAAAELAGWAETGYACAVRRADPRRWARLCAAGDADPGAAWRDEKVVLVRDAGFTEIPAGTVTVAAVYGDRGSPPVDRAAGGAGRWLWRKRYQG